MPDYFTLKRPCKNCPFRTDCLPGWLGRERAEEIAESLNQKSFECHETTEFSTDSDDYEQIKTGKEKHCAGALIMREKMDAPGQMIRIARRLGLYGRFKLKMDSKVFADSDEFIEHHSDPAHLREGTAYENAQDRNLRKRHAHGERCHTAKLVESDIPKIKSMLANGQTKSEIARNYGLSPSTVARAVEGKSRKHLTI